jgi:RPA family protein
MEGLTDTPRKRNTAYKMRIGDLLKGVPFKNEEKFLFLELGDQKISRVNIIANCVDRFIQDGEKKYASLTIDDASGQIRLKSFGEDIEVMKDLVEGDTLQIIGNVREWNEELYIIPEIVKKIDPRWLLVRKLEINETKIDLPEDAGAKNELRTVIMQKIKEAEVEGGIETEKLILDSDAKADAINVEINSLLEGGLIYEPRPGVLRYLG